MESVIIDLGNRYSLKIERALDGQPNGFPAAGRDVSSVMSRCQDYVSCRGAGDD
jgi:hypothetical protein